MGFANFFLYYLTFENKSISYFTDKKDEFVIFSVQ